MSAIKSLATKDSLWTGITAGVNTFKELIQATNQKKKKNSAELSNFVWERRKENVDPTLLWNIIDNAKL